MKRTLRSTLGGMLLTLALITSASAATTTSANDPDDTGGRLDIRYVEFRRDAGKVTLTLRTAEKWRCHLLEDDTSTAQGAAEAYDDGKAAFLLWSFENERHNNDDHSGFFRCKNGRLKFQFDRPEISYDVRRPNGRTVKVTLPVDRFGLDHRGLRLHAISQLNGQFGDRTFFEERDDSPRLRPYNN
ncbi:MAG: hypothetical protein M3N53_01320 [Actinomycetota bacterium]|nr:hypothetical protein [Actinomycetota bacterium]